MGGWMDGSGGLWVGLKSFCWRWSYGQSKARETATITVRHTTSHWGNANVTHTHISVVIQFTTIIPSYEPASQTIIDPSIERSAKSERFVYGQIPPNFNKTKRGIVALWKIARQSRKGF